MYLKKNLNVLLNLYHYLKRVRKGMRLCSSSDSDDINFNFYKENFI